MKLSVIGLGKLGSPMAAVFAANGFNVIGVDLNETFVENINQGIAPVDEPELQEHINTGRNNLTATTDFKHATLNSDISFIIVPTPSDETGFFSNEYLLNAIEEIALALREKEERHIIVITSTVMPGSTGGVIREKIESISGKKVGKDIGLCYNPEFIALGSVVYNMLHPDFILIGESDKESGDTLEKIYNQSCARPPIFRRMNWVNAEITKISVNGYVTTKISYTNMISSLCERLPEADAAVVLNAVGTDTRIGNKYLNPGLGFGGPCFPRDNVAFSALANKIGADSTLSRATDTTNKAQPKRILEILKKLETKSVAILGLSYKPNTPVIEESQSIMIANELCENGYDVHVFDPKAATPAKAELKDGIRICNSIDDALNKCDTILITVKWPEFVEYFSNVHITDKFIIDCCGIMDRHHDNVLKLGASIPEKKKQFV